MWRIRLLRILIPALLVPFLVLLVLELRPRRAPAPEPVPGDGETPRVVARGVEVVSLEGANRLFDLRADTYLEPREGHQKVEGVERLDLFREDASPLRITADLADIRGEAPNRVAVVRGGLHVRDEDAGMELELPTLQILEREQEARSQGEVRFAAPGYRGRAAAVVYPLDDRPTRFVDLSIESDDGDRMFARQARMLPGADDIELTEDVAFRSGTTSLNSPAMTVRRDADGGWIRRVEADLGVRGGDTAPGRPPASFQAHRLEATWRDRGELERVALVGDALIRQGDRGFAAAEIVATRTPDLGPAAWRVRGQGGVVATGPFDGSSGTLRSTILEAVVDENGDIVSGDAVGAVRFESPRAFAQADAAALATSSTGREVTLRGENGAKARLAEADRRVAADVVRLRPGTSWMRAEGRAEATLLPSGDGRDSARSAMFRDDEAIHFVARTIESDDSGSRLVFRGDVRGWQGERNLSADSVEYDLRSQMLIARGGVSTRMPLREGRGTTAADYVQVVANEMEYREANRRAEFRGDVRAKQDLGWVECDRLVIDLLPDGSGVRRMTGSGGVELEYRTRDADGMPRPMRGTADRIEYEPAAAVVRLFGDERPASVATRGTGGGTTQGRVIRYGLVDGSIEVEGNARVRTGDRGQ